MVRPDVDAICVHRRKFGASASLLTPTMIGIGSGRNGKASDIVEGPSAHMSRAQARKSSKRWWRPTLGIERNADGTCSAPNGEAVRRRHPYPARTVRSMIFWAVAAAVASTARERFQTLATSVPMPIVDVDAASAPVRVKLSSIESPFNTCPAMWSTTQATPNPHPRRRAPRRASPATAWSPS